MLRVVIYGSDLEENHRIRELIEDLLWAAKIKPVCKEFTGDRESFFTYVRNNPYLVMLIAQSGPEGAETARLAKEVNSAARLVWFSEQDYALYAFDLNLTFFGLLPINRSKAASALEACRFDRRYLSASVGVYSLSQTAPFPQPPISATSEKKRR